MKTAANSLGRTTSNHCKTKQLLMKHSSSRGSAAGSNSPQFQLSLSLSLSDLCKYFCLKMKCGLQPFPSGFVQRLPSVNRNDRSQGCQLEVCDSEVLYAPHACSFPSLYSPPTTIGSCEIKHTQRTSLMFPKPTIYSFL